MKIKEIIYKEDFKSYIKDNNGNWDLFIIPKCCFTLKNADIFIVEDNERKMMYPTTIEHAKKMGWIEDD